MRQLANPIRLDAFEGRSVRLPPPILGQHSEAALRDYGFSGDVIANLRETGVVNADKGLRLTVRPWEADAADHEALRAYQVDPIKTGKGPTPI